MADALSPGLIVADTFEVERLLGRGGMGEVWLGRHQRLAGKHVAIKVLHTQGALPAEALSRFRREAEIAARLEHPNIVQVIDFNSLPSGQPFIVMEYLKGESLAAKLKRGPLSPDELSHVMRQVGSALHAAHLSGVVHRDLKPENIFLVPTGLSDQVKVLDFGISKLNDGATMQTTDSVLMGTPLYMSPEQALGHNRDVTPQSDVFSLGSIAYECLAGKAPFEADNIAKVVFRIAYEPHVPLSTVAPHVPEVMARAVEHALAKDRANRSPSVAAFVLELTGQVLTNTGTNPAFVPPNDSGVLKPGSKVDEQMMASATMAPPSVVKHLATPNPSAVSQRVERVNVEPSSAAPPKSNSGPLIGVVVAVVAVVGIAAAVLLKPNAASTVTPDAGVSVPLVVPPPVIDAGTVSEPVDAGAPPVDAGVETDTGPRTPRPVAAALAPPSAHDQPVLRQVEADLAAGKVDEVWRREAAVRQALTSKEGVRDFMVMMVETACRRSDLGAATTRLRQIDAPAAKEQAKKRCRKFTDFEL